MDNEILAMKNILKPIDEKVKEPLRIRLPI